MRSRSFGNSSFARVRALRRESEGSGITLSIRDFKILINDDNDDESSAKG